MNRTANLVPYIVHTAQGTSNRLPTDMTDVPVVPVVLVPGGLTGWRSWQPMAERLASERPVIRTQLISVDRAETGTPVPDGYRLPTESAALRAALDEAGADRIDLVGWSYGAHVSLDFALTWPERVSTLTLIEPPASWLLRRTGYNPERLAGDEAFDRSLADGPVTVEKLRRFLVRAGLAQPGQDAPVLPQWPVWLQYRQAIAASAVIWDYDNDLDRLHRFDRPILMVHGDRTAATFIEIAAIIEQTAPNVTPLALPGDHACHLENPEAFLDALRAFLDAPEAVREAATTR